MDENKNIENKIKESFDGLNKSAKTDLWSKLSDKLSVANIDESIDKKIKNGFENTSNAVPPRVWGSVNRQLNVDRVWKRISAELDRRPVIIYWRKLAGIAALLLLLLSGSIYFFNNNNTPFVPVTGQLNKQEQKNAEELKQLADITDKGNLAEKNINARVAKTFNREKYPAQQNELTSGKNGTVPVSSRKINGHADLTLQKLKNFTGNTPEKPIKNTLSSDSIQLIAMIPVKTIFIGNIIPSDSILISSSTTEPFVPADTMPRRKKRFEIGIIYSHNNTWLVNNDTRKSFDENSLIQTIPTLSGSYGIVANYNVLNNSSVSAEFFINSKYIQRYDEFIEGVFNSRTTELNYYKLALLYQFNIRQSPYKVLPSKYTFKVGFYGSYLKNHTHDYTRVMSPETDTYTKTDYGARIAIGQEKTFKSFIIGYGLNAEYGFKNIFDGNPQVPSRFNVSRNALIGGYLNLKYRF